MDQAWSLGITYLTLIRLNQYTVFVTQVSLEIGEGISMLGFRALTILDTATGSGFPAKLRVYMGNWNIEGQEGKYR